MDTKKIRNNNYKFLIGVNQCFFFKQVEPLLNFFFLFVSVLRFIFKLEFFIFKVIKTLIPVLKYIIFNNATRWLLYHLFIT